MWISRDNFTLIRPRLSSLVSIDSNVTRKKKIYLFRKFRETTQTNYSLASCKHCIQNESGNWMRSCLGWLVVEWKLEKSIFSSCVPWDFRSEKKHDVYVEGVYRRSFLIRLLTQTHCNLSIWFLIKNCLEKSSNHQQPQAINLKSF